MDTQYEFKFKENKKVQNLSYGRSEHKVVQVRIGQTEQILLQDEGEYLHREILRRGLDQAGARYETVRFQEGNQLDDGLGPLLEGPDYKVHGMGSGSIHMESKLAFFEGHSSDYRIPLDIEKLEEVLAVTLPSNWQHTAVRDTYLPPKRDGKPY